MAIVSGLVRLVVRTIATVVAATFLVRVAIEISIPNGMEAVLFPNGRNPASERDAALAERFHLDDNLVVRHIKWIGDALGGDLGVSQGFASSSINEQILPRLSISGELIGVSAVLSITLGIGFGLLAVMWGRTRRGRALTGLLSLLQSIPVYVLPIPLIWLFAQELQWLPAAGWVRPSVSLPGNLETLAMPVATLVIVEVGVIARVVFSDVSRVLDSDYIAAAFAKGLGRGHVLFRHALRPGSLGLLNVAALNVGSLLAGTVFVELIFGIGGLGRLLLRASINRDLHMLLALTAWFVAIYAVLNALVDVAMRLADPRIPRVKRSVPGSDRFRRWREPTSFGA